jgi:hypothetical protein
MDCCPPWENRRSDEMLDTNLIDAIAVDVVSLIRFCGEDIQNLTYVTKIDT